MIAGGSDFKFGLCSTETLPRTSPTQHAFHQSLDTTIGFTTIIDNKECIVRFIFHPFRRHCNITYHEYEIQCTIPFSMSEKTVCRGSIIQVAQRLYDIHFFQNAGYKLALLESE
jgi:hypothetical protein